MVLSSKKTKKKNKKKKQKIQTKYQAHKILFELSRILEESIPLSNKFDAQFYQLSIQKIALIRNTIDGNDEFFNTIFLNKTEEEVKEWIENESKEW